MIPVSEGWKRAHKEKFLPETYIQIYSSVTEPGLQQEAVSSANQEESYSNAPGITSTVTVDREKYNTLEHNFWGLDGSFGYYNGNPSNPGYVTDVLSGEDAAFTALPTITLTFSSVHIALIPGVTITWTETFSEWASRFRITAYNGDSMIASTTVEDNTEPISQVWMDLVNYDKLVIEVLAWSHPQHRARVARVFLGIQVIYTKNDLLSYSHSQSVCLLSAVLPKNEIVFSLRNEDSRWNPENPVGTERYLMERQEVYVKYGMLVDGKKEWIDAGHFWLSGWNAPANGIEATFTARDLIEFMSEKYAGITSGTLYDIALAAFQQANLPLTERGEVRYVLHDCLKGHETSFTGENTIAEVLQKIAHMSCCIFYQDRYGIMRMEPHTEILSDYEINQDNSYTHPEMEMSKPLKAVEVSYGDNQRYTLPVGSSGEVQTVHNDFVRSEADAHSVAEKTARILRSRTTYTGEFRADPRLDVLDMVTLRNKYSDHPAMILSIEYSTTGGGFKGKYSGR